MGISFFSSIFLLYIMFFFTVFYSLINVLICLRSFESYLLFFFIWIPIKTIVCFEFFFIVYFMLLSFCFFFFLGAFSNFIFFSMCFCFTQNGCLFRFGIEF